MDWDTWRVTRGGGKSWTRDKDIGNVDGCVERGEKRRTEDIVTG